MLINHFLHYESLVFWTKISRTSNVIGDLTFVHAAPSPLACHMVTLVCGLGAICELDFDIPWTQILDFHKGEKLGFKLKHIWLQSLLS